MKNIRWACLLTIILCGCREAPGPGGFNIPTQAQQGMLTTSRAPAQGWIPRISLPDHPDSLGLRIVSVTAVQTKSKGEPVLSLQANIRWLDTWVYFSRAGQPGFGYHVFADLEVYHSGHGTLRSIDHMVHTFVPPGQLVGTGDELTTLYLDKRCRVHRELPLGALCLSPGKQELDIAVKLYLYMPVRDGNDAHDRVVGRMVPLPFAVLNGKASVNMPEMKFYKIQMLGLRLNTAATGTEYDAHIDGLGSGYPDLEYTFLMNDRLPIYQSPEYTNALDISEPSDMFYAGLEPGDSLIFRLVDDDDGFLGIGEKKDLVGQVSYGTEQLDHWEYRKDYPFFLSGFGLYVRSVAPSR